MDPDSFELPPDVVELFQLSTTYVSQPWFAYQILIIALLYIVARVAASRLEPRFEQHARRIKGHPGLLRFIVATLRRMELIVYILLLACTLAVMHWLTWPSRSYLIYVALTLAFAWLVISVLSRGIRSRAVGRLLALGVWIYVAVTIFGVDENVAGFLDDLDFSAGDLRISALLVLKAAVLITLTLWLAVSLGNFLDGRVQRSEELTPSLRLLVGKVLKIILVSAAVLVVLSGLGIDLTVFTVFSGAVGVGVGFGLRAIASNFISGIIILLDRSIKPGDTISLGETFGWIRELRARFVSVVTRDGREYLIPNEDFITREVINWSFSDELVRLDVEFGVAYDADAHLVSALAIEAAASVARVVPSKKPVCWMTAFGDSSLDFILRFWINDPQNGLTNIRGQVLLALWDKLKEHGVNVPYPHREIIMRTPVQLEKPPTRAPE